MDNTDVKRKVILTKSSFNSATGESVIRTKPKPVKKKKTVLARGKRNDGFYSVGDVLLSRLRPLKRAMILGLQQKGINTVGLNFKTLTVTYYNLYCVNPLNKKPFDVSAFINLPAFKISPESETTGDPNDARNKAFFMDIVEVADSVILIFRAARERYDNLIQEGFDPKEMLTDEELLQAKAAIIVENDLLRRFRSDNFLKIEDYQDSLFWIAGFALLIFVIQSIDA